MIIHRSQDDIEIARNPVRLILHAGMHKTGSTALQNSLYHQRDPLRNAGILYPITGLHFGSPQAGIRHRGLRQSLEQQGSRGFAVDRLKKEIAESACHTAILSYEGFFTPTTNVEHLCEALDGFDISVVVYLRHPVDYIESKYREWVRLLRYSGEIDRFLEWQWPSLGVTEQADVWRKKFGQQKVIFRSYESLQSPRDIINQLLGLVPDCNITLEPHPERNPSPTNEDTLVKLLANQMRLAGRPIRSKLVKSIDLNYGSNGGRLLSTGAVEEIRARAEFSFESLLKRNNDDAALISQWAERPRDNDFFDSAVRVSVIQKLERMSASVDCRKKLSSKPARNEQVSGTPQAGSPVRDEHRDAMVSQLERRLTRLEKRLARSRRSRRKLKTRLTSTRNRLREVECRLEERERRHALIKVWRLENWPEYAAILKRILRPTDHRAK